MTRDDVLSLWKRVGDDILNLAPTGPLLPHQEVHLYVSPPDTVALMKIDAHISPPPFVSVVHDPRRSPDYIGDVYGMKVFVSAAVAPNTVRVRYRGWTRDFPFKEE